MCGIIGYVGRQEVTSVIIEGLRRLEYRGYDSAGIAFLNHGRLDVRRCSGKLKNLENALVGLKPDGRIAIGHTRWATHGRPSEENAHPHRAGHVVLVHNGIIENYLTLKEELSAEGREFRSETDTEAIVHLIHHYMDAGQNLESAVRSAAQRLKGAYAVCVMSEKEPDHLVAVRNGCPLVVGLGEGEVFAASDIPAILSYTRNVIFLDDGEMAILDSRGAIVKNASGARIDKKPQTIAWDAVMAEKGGYKHFMLKEIHEQPRAVTDTLRGRLALSTGDVLLDEMRLDAASLREMRRLTIVACGTSWHAALVGKYLIEHLARVPVDVDIGSEFRYRDPLIGENDILLAISQSGETADTLAAMREARAKGGRVISICNVVGSTASRESDGVIYTHAGPEIGVASTKAFTAQLTALYLLAVTLGRQRGTLTEDRGRSLLEDLVRVPMWIESILSREDQIVEMAKKYFKRRDFLYLGRGINYPIALEGALKLKEISYIHAEGYPAGEMKHGPIALIDENMPVIVLAPSDAVIDKVLSNLMEVKARDGTVVALVSEGDVEVSRKADDSFAIPRVESIFNPILLTVPLQLLAYHIAVLRGSDVDQPRNLAKSVTVE